MRVILSTYDSRGGVEPLAALAVQLKELGAEALVCAPPDCAERLAELGVPLVPIGKPTRELVHGSGTPDVNRLAADFIGLQLDRLAKAAQGCDAIVTSGLLPVVAGAQSVAELLGVPSVNVSYCPVFLSSPHHRPPPLPGRPVPADVTDPAALDELDAANYNGFLREPLNEHRAAAGLPPVDDVRAFVRTARPWLAADPVLAPWPGGRAGVVQTGAWFVTDERPLPADLEAFLDAGPLPVFLSFGSMPAPEGFARAAVDAIRARGRRVVLGRGWAGLDGDEDCFVVGEVNQQALFKRVAVAIHHGGAGTTTTATRAGVPQIVVPQWADQPYFAGRVAALGIGAAAGAGSLDQALDVALRPGTRQRAAAVAATVRTDGAAVAARRLLDLADQQE
ncbi:glycosyltransferase [Dactylosporangium sp. NPDC049140]|uniref:glycosyltransferase n=1 Tax=Dactylosporangium sp. NPDC049140 TaxID=3155647 RepID=UPI0033C77663